MNSPVGSWLDVACENAAAAPSNRTHHGCAVYKDCLYIFGGYKNGNLLNDFYEFNFANKRWRVVPAAGLVPSPRYSHTCVVYKDAFYVFAGHDGRSYLNDLMEYNFLTQRWSVVKVNAGNAPAPRYNHSAVVYDGNHRRVNDLHEFNFDTGTWTSVCATGTVPPPRSCSSLVVFENSCFLFGGSGGSDRVNDVHVFDFVCRTWSTLVAEGLAPTPRNGHVAVIHSNAMYVFGGYTDMKMNDFHKLTLGSSESRKWQAVPCEGPAPPPACHYGTAADYDSSLIVFGGSGDDAIFTQFRFDEAKNNQTSSLISDLRQFVNNDIMSDITFVVEGIPIHAHKILCVRCSYFKAMLTGEMLESRAREVAIDDVRHPIFLLFLEYLYTDHTDVSMESAVELLEVADRYGVDGLKRICERHMLTSLSVANAATILHAADLHNAADLRGQCLSFMLTNFDAVTKTTAFAEMSRTNVELVLELLKLR